MKWWLLTIPVVLLVFLLFNGGCMVFGIRTVEQASYAAMQQDGAFEIRRYEDLVVAETAAAGDREASQEVAFKRLFRYISGDNIAEEKVAMTAPVLQEPASTKVAMTAPVLQEQADDGWRMAFVLPDKYDLETAPRPTDPEVSIRKQDGGRFAVVRFSGVMTEAAIHEQTQRLREWMADQGLQAVSEPRSAGYDPPFTIPFLRRNEIMIEIPAAGE